MIIKEEKDKIKKSDAIGCSLMILGAIPLAILLVKWVIENVIANMTTLQCIVSACIIVLVIGAIIIGANNDDSWPDIYP